ncbi:MAG: hypothetical protein ACXWLA_07645 [Myxococcaceae bacterium]
MLTDEDLEAVYEERGVPTDWMEMTPEAMAPAFRMYFRALPSAGTNRIGHEDAELLIKDPLTALRNARIDDTPILGPEETPRISTMVVNHEKTLNRFIMYATVVVSTNPSTVGITLVKEAE